MRVFFVQEKVERCFESGEKLETQEVQVEFIFTEDVVEFTLPLPYASQSRIYYMPMQFLEDISQRLELLPYDLEAITIDAQETEIFLASAEGYASWKELLAQANQSQNLPQASFLEAKARPLGVMTWELVGGPGAWVDDLGDGQAGLTQIYLLVDADSGAVLSMKMVVGSPNRQDLVELVSQAVVYPMGDVSQSNAKRPARIHTADVSLLELLYEPMQALGVGLKLAEIPSAQAAFESLMQHMGVNQIPHFFSRYDEGEIISFLKAADAFFALRPWERLSGRKYLGFRIDNGDWHYCNVMGQAGEEFGLAMFTDWLELCRFVHNQPSPLHIMMGLGLEKQLKAAGGAESLSLHKISELNAEDIGYLQNLGLKREEYPLSLRLTLESLEMPRFDLETYQVLLQGLTAVLERRSASQISSIKKTLEIEGKRLELRYPAKGFEAMESDLPSYRLHVEAEAKNGPQTLSGVQKELCIEASGDVTLHQLAIAIRNELEGEYVSGFGLGYEMDNQETDQEVERGLEGFLSAMSDSMGTLLWTDRHDGHYGPHLRLAQLEGLQDLWLEQWMNYYPLRLERLNQALPSVGVIKISKT